MSLGYRLVTSAFAGLLALFVLKALGVPFWRPWDIGDQADGFAAAACLTLCLTLPHRDGVEQRGSTSTTEPNAVPGTNNDLTS